MIHNFTAQEANKFWNDEKHSRLPLICRQIGENLYVLFTRPEAARHHPSQLIPESQQENYRKATRGM